MKQTRIHADDDETAEVLTVSELIELLRSMPQDAEVWHQGCDCQGTADGVKLQDDGTVLITRSN
jgi:hypothetical protein